MNYTTIIGLEIHIEPNTVTKMFCGCPQDHFGKKPNTQTCPICLGLPGALPYANYEAIKKTVTLGLAIGSNISNYSNFFRKHYFYPDLPKSFQTSQKDFPLCVGGELMGKTINHIHLEEDAGKLIHQTVDSEKVSLVDFNRGGCALIELVTEPVFRSAEEVLAFTKEIQTIARYLDVSGADMEKGTMRLEANISLSTDPNGKLPDYKVEIKNINSFRFLANAIDAEVKRQKNALEKGEKLIQETRGYDEVKKTTFSQRSKEESQDYRYFPEADLPPIVLSAEDIEDIRKTLPELPGIKRDRFVKEYGIGEYFSELLTADRSRADYFEIAAKLAPKYGLKEKTIADLMVNKNLDSEFEEPELMLKKLVELTKKDGVDDAELDISVTEVIKEQVKAVEDYKTGKTQVIGFLVGQVQKKLNGKGDPAKILKSLRSKL